MTGFTKERMQRASRWLQHYICGVSGIAWCSYWLHNQEVIGHTSPIASPAQWYFFVLLVKPWTSMNHNLSSNLVVAIYLDCVLHYVIDWNTCTGGKDLKIHSFWGLFKLTFDSCSMLFVPLLLEKKKWVRLKKKSPSVCFTLFGIAQGEYFLTIVHCSTSTSFFCKSSTNRDLFD